MTPQDLQTLIANQIATRHDIEVPDFEVTYAEQQFGDFSANVAFKLARDLKKSPAVIAEELAAQIRDVDIAHVEAVAGYLNITMQPHYWVKQLSMIDDQYGHTEAPTTEKVQVEFISANPTGPTTFGNARGGFIGDVIARVLATQGHKVTREYYFNDGGTQISKLVESVKVAAGLISADEVQYRGEYIDELAREFGGQLKTATSEEAATLLTQAILKRHIEPAVRDMNITFDEWFNERSLGESGEVEAMLERLKAEDLVYEQDGAVWLASTKLGDERDRVLRKSSGDLTYLANDIAYHLNIFEKRDFDWAIKQWGADHAGQVPSLRLIMQKLAPNKRLDFNIHQWVRLVKDGEEMKMSKRAGTYITVEEVIGEVGSDVTRFFFLLRSADSQMDFDLDLAREQSQKNPLFYVMYSYARANSIIRKAVERKLIVAKANYTKPTKIETQLIKQLTQWPELLAQVAGDYQVQKLAHYGLEVATLFQKLYEEVNILALPEVEATAKLYLIEQFKTFMDGYFAVLGITPQQTMTRDTEAE